MPEPGGTTHRISSSLTHAVSWQLAFPTATLGYESFAPKLAPRISSVDPPLFGAWLGSIRWITGEAYDHSVVSSCE